MTAGYGIWAQITQKASEVLKTVDGSTFTTILSTGTPMLIALGCIFALMGLIGFCGTLKKKSWMLLVVSVKYQNVLKYLDISISQKYCPVLICLFFFTFISVLHRCAHRLHPPAHRGSVYPPPKFSGNLIFYIYEWPWSTKPAISSTVIL